MIDKQQEKYYEGTRVFIAAIESCRLKKMETIDIFLDLIRKHIMWHYDYKYFNISKGEIPDYKRESKFIDIFKDESFVPKQYNLRDLCILSDLWNPEKLVRFHGTIFFDENENADNFIFLKHMKIGKVLSDGNHRTFVAINYNQETQAWVREYNDERILREGYTDGEYLYFRGTKTELPDERFAMLFSLTKLRLGLISLEELNKECSSYWSNYGAVKI